MLVGIGLGVAQQLTGINSIMYYGQSVLVEAGFDSSGALIANIAPPGVIAVVGGVIALTLMQRINRRTTLLLGFTLTTVCHFLIGIASIVLPVGNAARPPFVILFLVVAFVGSMQTFLNIAVWVMLSEIFPLHVRGFAIGLSVFCLWIANALLGLFFPHVGGGRGDYGNVLPLWDCWDPGPRLHLHAGSRNPRTHLGGTRRRCDHRCHLPGAQEGAGSNFLELRTVGIPPAGLP